MPTPKVLYGVEGGHRYVVDVVSHASQPEIARLLADHAEFRLLGPEGIEFRARIH